MTVLHQHLFASMNCAVIGGCYFFPRFIVATVTGLLLVASSYSSSVLIITQPPTGGTPTYTPSYSVPADDANYLVAHEFNEADGINPNGLVMAPNGVLVGTAGSGGPHGGGTLFTITDPAATRQFTLLHAFGTADDPLGHTPVENGLVIAPDGTIYGLTKEGGEHAGGAIFKITPEGNLSLLHAMSQDDGIHPVALLMGSDGRLYGLSAGDGAGAQGSLFQVTTAGEVTVIWRIPNELTAKVRLGTAEAGLAEAGDGDFYVKLGGQYIYRYYRSSSQERAVYFTGLNNAEFVGNIVASGDGSLWAAEGGPLVGMIARFSPEGPSMGTGQVLSSIYGQVVSLLRLGNRVLVSAEGANGRNLWLYDGQTFESFEGFMSGPALRSLTVGGDARVYAVRRPFGAGAAGQIVSIALPPNRDPVARMDRVEENTGIPGETPDGPTRTYRINVLGNDYDFNNDTLTVTATSRPDVTINADGTLSFTQRLAVEPTVRFTYTVSDGRGGLATALVRIGNRDPVAQADRYLRRDQLGPNGRLDVLANDTDPDGDPIRIVGVSWNPALRWPSTGTEIYYSSWFSPFEYIQLPEVEGQLPTGTFTYTISDGETQATATVLLGNQLPVALGERLDEPTETRQLPTGETEFVYHIAPLANDSDPDGDVLQITQIGEVSDQFQVVEDHVSVDYAPPVGRATLNADGTITFITTAAGGRGTFVYTVSDSLGATATARVRLGNAAPVAVDDTVSCSVSSSNEDVLFQPLNNDRDPDADTLHIVSVGAARYGTAVLYGGQIQYIPGPTYTDFDEFTYTVSDDKGATATARVRVTNVFYRAAGTYTGTVYNPVGIVLSGSLRVRLLSNGVFTGTLILDGKALPLKGVIDENGRAALVINRPRQQPLHLHFSMASTTGGGQVLEGVVSVGIVPENQPIPVAYAVNAGKTVFTGEAGYYTVALSVNAASPDSGQSEHGFARMTVAKSGSVRLTGRFHNGVPFAAGAKLRSNSSMPLSIKMSPARGRVTGEITFGDQSTVNDCSGTLHWPSSKSAQAPTEITLIGSRYRPPQAGERILLVPQLDAEFAGGGLPDVHTEAVTLTPNHQILADVTGSSLLNLSVVPATGLVKGSFVPPGASSPVQVQGVVLQKQNAAVGLFTNGRNIGSFTLSPRQ